MVFETIREFLCEQLACDESRVTPDTVMLEDLEMEPSDLGDLMLSLEQEFGIEWTDDDLQGIRTVGDLTAFVENQEYAKPAQETTCAGFFYGVARQC